MKYLYSCYFEEVNRNEKRYIKTRVGITFTEISFLIKEIHLLGIAAKFCYRIQKKAINAILRTRAKIIACSTLGLNCQTTKTKTTASRATPMSTTLSPPRSMSGSFWVEATDTSAAQQK